MSAILKKLIGTTVKVTWVNSAVTPSAISAALFNGSDTLVSSESMTSSGNGHYWAAMTLPNSIGLYVAETLATISAKPYRKRATIKAVTGGTD